MARANRRHCADCKGLVVGLAIFVLTTRSYRLIRRIIEFHRPAPAAKFGGETLVFGRLTTQCHVFFGSKGEFQSIEVLHRRLLGPMLITTTG